MNLGKLYNLISVNVPPVASNLNISGEATQGQTLTGSYNYYDREGDLEGASIFRWLSASTEGGTYSAIEEATSITYVLQSTDVDKYIKFEVTPVALTGKTTGLPALSSALGPIASSIPYPATLSSAKFYVQNDADTILDDGGAPASNDEAVATWVGYVNSKNITQATPSRRYKYKSSNRAINSYGDSSVKMMVLPAIDLDGTAGKTIFIKYNLATTGTLQILLNKESVATYIWINTDGKLFFRLASNDIAYSAAGTITAGTHIMQIDISASGTVVKVDNVQKINDVDVFTMDLTTPWNIGRSDGAWNTISMDILSVGIFDGTMSDEGKTNVYNHLLTL